MIDKPRRLRGRAIRVSRVRVLLAVEDSDDLPHHVLGSGEIDGRRPTGLLDCVGSGVAWESAGDPQEVREKEVGLPTLRRGHEREAAGPGPAAARHALQGTLRTGRSYRAPSAASVRQRTNALAVHMKAGCAPWRGSVHSERRDRIDAGGAQGGNRRGEHARRDDDQQARGVRHGIEDMDDALRSARRRASPSGRSPAPRPGRRRPRDRCRPGGAIVTAPAPTTFLVVAPSAMRTPISFARCSTTYDRTLNRPDTVSTSASPPSTTVTQKAIRRMDVCIPAIDRMVLIAPKPGSTLVRRSSSAWRACSGSPRTRSVSDVPAALGTGRQVHAPEGEQVGHLETAPHIAHDADDRERARRAATVRPASPIAEPGGAPPARRRCDSARAGARRSRTRPRRPPPRCVPPA